MELLDRSLLDLILTSFRERKVLCDLVLATYRVELTKLLHRVADGKRRDGDITAIADLAGRIRAVARTARISAVRKDADALEQRAHEVLTTGATAERPMLAAGLQVIDRILSVANDPAKGAAAKNGAELN